MRAIDLVRIALGIVEKHGANAPVHVPTIIDESAVESWGEVDGATPDAIRSAIARVSAADTPDDLYMAIEAEHARISDVANDSGLNLATS